MDAGRGSRAPFHHRPAGNMEREASPSPPAAATPSRLRRTLQSLRSPFRSPFHLPTRRGSNSASDGDLARDGRTMRKRNKKSRESAPAAAAAAPVASDASRSTDTSPSVEKKKGFIRRMGSIGKKREVLTSAPSLQQSTKESSLESEPLPRSEPQSSEASTSKSPTPEIPISKKSTPDTPTQEARPHRPPSPEARPPRPPTPESPPLAFEPPASESAVSAPESAVSAPEPAVYAPEPAVSAPEPAVSAPEPSTPELVPEPPTPEPSTLEPVSPISVVHPVAIRPFTKSAWKRKKKLEIPKPVEEPSPESALRRRIAFVSQASAWLSEEERGARGVGSLEEAVALACRLARAHDTGHDTEEEGYSDAMPAYGDLIEPTSKPSHASPSSERREHLYKILVIGELGTGKTSIIKRYVHQFFSQHYRATIGVDFALKVLNWDANTVIRLQLWDIAGQERFGNMTRVYYKEAVGAFIVYDVSRVATFDAVVKWKNDLDSKVQLPDGSPIPCVLLANKCDQQKEGIVNSPSKMEEYCREKGFAGWFETSAKENINIEEAARSLVNKILLNDKLLQSNDNRDGERFALEHKIANGENSRDSNAKSCNC